MTERKYIVDYFIRLIVFVVGFAFLRVIGVGDIIAIIASLLITIQVI